MPYIRTERRAAIDEIVERADDLFDIGRCLESPGDLNYALTTIIKGYLYVRGPISYQLLNDIMGAIESAKAEFYRRKVVPYEISKEQENGDVY